MKTLIRKTLFTAFVFTFAASVSAQEMLQKEQITVKEITVKEVTVKEMAVIETEAISMQLNESLTPEQTEKLTKINQDFFVKKKELKGRQATIQEFTQLYQNRDDSVKLVLTQEQFKTWKENPVAKKIQGEIKQIEINKKKQPKNITVMKKIILVRCARKCLLACR